MAEYEPLTKTRLLDLRGDEIIAIKPVDSEGLGVYIRVWRRDPEIFVTEKNTVKIEGICGNSLDDYHIFLFENNIALNGIERTTAIQLHRFYDPKADSSQKDFDGQVATISEPVEVTVRLVKKSHPRWGT